MRGGTHASTISNDLYTPRSPNRCNIVSLGDMPSERRIVAIPRADSLMVRQTFLRVPVPQSARKVAEVCMAMCDPSSFDQSICPLCNTTYMNVECAQDMLAEVVSRISSENAPATRHLSQLRDAIGSEVCVFCECQLGSVGFP